MLIKDKTSGILYRAWKSQNPKGILILIHGYGAHSGRWEFLADFFIKKNLSIYALELKGYGFSEGRKGHVDSFNIYFNDIRTLYEIAKSDNPGNKIFLLGESAGALISILFVNLKPSLFNGLILLSPAFKNKLRFSLFNYIKIFLFSFFFPKSQITMPFRSDVCSRDTEYQKIMDATNAEHRIASAKLLFETWLGQIACRFFRCIVSRDQRILFLVAGNDKLMDSEFTKKIFKRLAVNDKEIIEYPDMYHSLSIDIGREKVFEDIFNWIKKRW